jgi:DNA-binding response OmpR family regulator
MGAHILVVDDDADLCELLQRYLGEHGLEVITATSGKAMEKRLAEGGVDLIVLDVVLPDVDGLSLPQRLRGRHDGPIIMLSSRGQDVDRIVGLEMGADDYLPKPFNPRELLARIRALLRRGRQRSDTTVSSGFGPFCLDTGRRRLLRDGKEVTLTTGEYALLLALAERPNRVLGRDALLDIVRKERGDEVFDRSIDVRITRLRRKIEADPANPVYIRTVWGEGYVFTPEG